MTEKEHDVNYADPEEEQKGNWEKKVNLSNQASLNKMNRSTYQLSKRLLVRRARNASSRWEWSSTGTERSNGRREVLVTSSSWDTRRPRKSDASWDKRRLSSQLLTSWVSYPQSNDTNCGIIVQESPLCELVPMKNNDKAYLWTCNDFSEEEPKLEKLAARAQTVESKQSYN